VIVRYLGFPYWDILVYPVQALANVGERDAVEVVRMSPREATLLWPSTSNESKLKGVILFHFGAFLRRDYRENDYLWGRLDAAELLIKLVLRGGDTAAERSLQLEAFEAVLREEKPSLRGVRPLVTELEQRLARLRAEPAAGVGSGARFTPARLP